MDKAVNELRAPLKPLVSIIIPCYNLDGYLDNCLNSCILQTYGNLEIINLMNNSQWKNTKISIEDLFFDAIELDDDIIC